MTVHDVHAELVMGEGVQGQGEVHQGLHQSYEGLLELPLHGGHQPPQQPLYHVNNSGSGQVSRNLKAEVNLIIGKPWGA